MPTTRWQTIPLLPEAKSVFQSIAYGKIWEIFIGINDIIKTKNLPSKNAYKQFIYCKIRLVF